MKYKLLEMCEWFKKKPEGDMLAGSIEFCLYYHEIDMNSGEIMPDYNYIANVEYCHRHHDELAWHILNVSSESIFVSFNDFNEDDYTMDTTFFTSVPTEETYFQFCTMYDHKHLSTEELYALVEMSLTLRDIENKLESDGVVWYN